VAEHNHKLILTAKSNAMKKAATGKDVELRLHILVTRWQYSATVSYREAG